MNKNARRDIEGRKLIVACMTMKAIENELAKGQKNGDATKVVAGGEIEEINDLTPRIETNVGYHTVDLDKSSRILPNGQVMRIKVKEEDRKMQLARIEEQEEQEEDIEK